jgi:AraC family transcriptional regulator
MNPFLPSVEPRPRPALGASAQAHPDWPGLPIHLHPLPADGEVSDLRYPVATVVLACSGHGRRWYTQGLVTRELRSAPGMVDVLQAGHHIDRARWHGESGELIALQLPRLEVGQLLGDDGARLELPTQHELFDPELAGLLNRLWREAAAGAPSGALYVQGLTLALLGWLTRGLGPRAAGPGARPPPFGADKRTRLRDFVQAELSTHLGVARLAAVVGLSPDHFSRQFKATFGCSPHQYVQACRVDAAARALREEPDRPVADIAAGCGFASQAHFTDVFRRRTGATPSQWRRAR